MILGTFRSALGSLGAQLGGFSGLYAVVVEPEFIDVAGSYQAVIDVAGSYQATIDIIGSYQPTIDAGGEWGP